MPFQGGRNLICSQKKYKVPPNLMVLSVGAEIEIKVGRNMKSRWKEIQNQVETNPSQRFPKFDGLSKSPSNFEDVFRHFSMNLSDFFLVLQVFQCTWEGSSIISYKFGAQQVTLFGLYFFRIAPQGVAALVSVSDGKIKITILILRRGALSRFKWQGGVQGLGESRGRRWPKI